MKSIFFALFLVLVAPLTNADTLWTKCSGHYYEEFLGKPSRSDFFIQIQNDSNFSTVEFAYLFTDADAKFRLPITKRLQRNESTVSIEVSFQNSSIPFASFDVVHRDGVINAVDNFVATDPSTMVTIGPIKLVCER